MRVGSLFSGEAVVAGADGLKQLVNSGWAFAAGVDGQNPDRISDESVVDRRIRSRGCFQTPFEFPVNHQSA